MDAFLPHLADVVIAWLLVEGALVVWHHRRTGRGVAPRDFAAAWCAGLFLALALRGALAGTSLPVLALLLLAAGLAHAADLRRRWRPASGKHRGPPAGPGP
jgi:hypothetical protein